MNICFRPGARAAVRRWTTSLLAGGFWVGATLVAAETAGPPALITNPDEIWALPTDQKSLPHPLQIEGRISYFDPWYRMIWIEQNSIGRYLQLAASPPPIRTGQYVVIAGKITPSKGLSADDVTVRVVEEHAPITPLDTRDRINDLTAFHGRVVTAEGYVDSQLLSDNEHLRLILIVENRPVICWIKADNSKKAPDWRGNFVRVTGLYSRRFDPTQTNTTIEIWLENNDGLQTLGTLEKSRQFDKPATPISELYLTQPGTEVRVRGQVESHRVGMSLIVRDDTGQVEIRSIQQQRLPLGAEVEAVGRVSISGSRWVIDPALYRPVNAGAATTAVLAAPDAPLRTVAEIRALGAEEAAQSRPVDIRGIVVWTRPGNDFLYLEDVTGGIRVYYDVAKTGNIRFDKYLQVKGVTRAGQVAPAVEMNEFRDLGSLSHPTARPITLEEALTGKEEGEWVELRGFIEDTVAGGDWRWIHVTTPAGNFTGQLQNPVTFVANPGSLIRVSGICEANLDADGRITDITLRVPFLEDITVEEEAPADFYNLPRRAIRDLDRLSSGQNMTRVRITGEVLHAVPGELVYVQEGGAAVMVLSRNSVPLTPGDKIEAVGVLGREGVRTVLREAVYRKTGTGPPPVPAALADPARLSVANDSRLVRVRGILIDEFDRQGLTRLTLQAGSTIFEATLGHTAKTAPLYHSLGTGLELTGVYRLEFDDSRQMQGFGLQLRSPADLVVFQEPRLWTLQRALAAAAVLGGCTVLGLAWITALRRRVHRQTEQIRKQLEHQANLEADVQRAARLESLGVLAGGIAHDFNNALTSIMGYTSMAMFDRRAMDSVGNYLREIERGAHRARDLTQQLLTFAKGGDPLRKNLALPELIHTTAERVLHGTDLRCECEEPPGLWDIKADEGQISQVLQNLLRNARQVMPQGGVIRVQLANEEISAGGRSGLPAGRYVRVAVTDTGKGVSAENLPRIFEPYFSPGDSGGLGLATVHSIIKKHQGLIDVQSTLGKGTTFRIWLPAAQPEAPEPQAALPTARIATAPPRVLLMDDEESIRQLGAIALQRMGLEASVVADGAGAVREFETARKAGWSYDLVILDLTVPGGMGGKETIERLREIDPSVLAIVSSGYSSDPVLANYRNYGFQAIVPKPYDLETFTRIVAQLLKEGRGISLPV